jgi:hypothetical protein
MRHSLSEIERASSSMSSRSESTPSPPLGRLPIATILSPVRRARREFITLHLYSMPEHVAISRLCLGGVSAVISPATEMLFGLTAQALDAVSAEDARGGYFEHCGYHVEPQDHPL